MTPPEAGASRREPILNAPWTIVVLIVGLLAAHAARVLLGIGPQVYALTPQQLNAGRWSGLITYQFVHGGWAHVLMNSLFILAFGTPVARYFGAGARGGGAFFAFFLLCGVVAALAYSGATSLGGGAQAAWALLGASGAASGLMGAAARLMGGHGRLGGVGSRTVVSMTFSWVIMNAVLGLSGLTPGAAGIPVAWQAHIFGFLAGLALIGPAAWAAGVATEKSN